MVLLMVSACSISGSLSGDAGNNDSSELSNATVLCIDSPTTHKPGSAYGREAGDVYSTSWTNRSQGCTYQTDYELRQVNGGLDWVVSGFHFKMSGLRDSEGGKGNE